jgi:hypothetical protein
MFIVWFKMTSLINASNILDDLFYLFALHLRTLSVAQIIQTDWKAMKGIGRGLT